MDHHYKQNLLQTYHDLFPAHIGVTRCLAQPPRGSTTRLHTNTHSSGRLAPPRPPIPPLSSLTTRAYHTHARAHFTPQHWILCHMGWYEFEFVRSFVF